MRDYNDASCRCGVLQIWGGVIGGLGLEEDSRAADFYASYYNDHVREQQRERKPCSRLL